MKMKQRLTLKEEEVMNIIWENGEMFIRDIVAQMPEPKPNYNTVATQVKFLEEKGFVERRPMANSFQYRAVVSEREYRGTRVGAIVSKYYNNSYASVVSQFVEDDKMDLDELKALIAQIEKKRK
ncbi:MAG TPA: BlaI/MecI/CopY family transcriptional regulator [Bacteroidales bacterium]|jgi:BlaI family penicillinase repressor|nr:BlaI/MecI/CopY family transcriptional regulator [Bacteroidales bacterium]